MPSPGLAPMDQGTEYCHCPMEARNQALTAFSAYLVALQDLRKAFGIQVASGAMSDFSERTRSLAQDMEFSDRHTE